MTTSNMSPRFSLLSMLPLLLVSIFFGGCAMVYSPFLHLPAAPEEAGQVAVSGGASIMPETSFGWSADGGEGILRWGVTDNFTLVGRAWSRTGNIPSLNIDGTSLDAIISFGTVHSRETPALQNDVRYASFQWGLIPRVMSLFGGNELGLAGSMSVALWLPSFWILRPYVATGGIFGGGVDGGSYGGTAVGYGMINNLGFSTTFDRHWSINAELANTIQRVNNPHESGNITWIYLLPSISMSYRF